MRVELQRYTRTGRPFHITRIEEGDNRLEMISADPDPRLQDVVLVSPSPDYLATLPDRKLPDRKDFEKYVGDDAGRERSAGALADAPAAREGDR